MISIFDMKKILTNHRLAFLVWRKYLKVKPGIILGTSMQINLLNIYQQKLNVVIKFTSGPCW